MLQTTDNVTLNCTSKNESWSLMAYIW